MKRYFLLFLAAMTAVLPLAAQVRWNKTYQDYLDTYKDVAIEQMLQYGIPASITLAQGVLESGAGTSLLTRKSNNHFGIKCHGWTGGKSYHDDDARNECFRAYGSAYESYVDHSLFLTGSQRYSRLFRLKRTDYKGWAKGLKECGYATNPAYAQRLIDIIQVYKLHRYDTEKKYDRQLLARAKQGAQRPVSQFNKNYYVTARRGDTFRTLADEVDVSYRRLAKYNERDKNDALEEGERVWLKKKRSNVQKSEHTEVHVVRAGDSMYSISQQYGLQLKALYRLNRLEPTYIIKVGDRLRLR